MDMDKVAASSHNRVKMRSQSSLLDSFGSWSGSPPEGGFHSSSQTGLFVNLNRRAAQNQLKRG